MRIVLIIVLCCKIMFAYDAERAEQNLADDFANCAAYYMLSADGAKNSGNNDLELKLMKVSNFHYLATIELSNEKTATAKVKLAFEKHKKTIEHHFKNFSRLLIEYNDFCQELSTKPQSRMKYWLDKKD